MEIKKSDYVNKNILLEGSRKFEAPRFYDSRHMKVVRLSAIRTGRVYRTGDIPGTDLC